MAGGQSNALQWSCGAFRLAVAPWRRDFEQQQVVEVQVDVFEQRAPEFALRFEFKVVEEREKPESNEEEGDKWPGRWTRVVTQRQMLSVFEFAFVGAGAGCRPPSAGDELKMEQELDVRVKHWLAGGGQVEPPPRDELARWLLARMMLTSAAEDTCKHNEQTAPAWKVSLCGETGAERMLESSIPLDESDVAEGKNGGTGNDGDCGASSEDDTEDDDLPPAYEEAGCDEPRSPSSETTEEDVDRESPVQVGADTRERDKAVDDLRSAMTSSSNRSLMEKETSSHPPLVKRLSKRRSSARSSSSRSLKSASSSSTDKQREKPMLKPTVVRLNPRVPSLDVVRPHDAPNVWTEDKRHFQQELVASRRELQSTKQQLEKVQGMAALRHSRLLKETARALRLNEQKRRDAREVRQLIADTLEYREELLAMEFQVKQAKISAHREQERVKRGARVVLGNTEKPLRGAVKLGPGPLSEREMQLLYGTPRDGNAVYDQAGRRHRVEEAELVAEESAFESAMRKVRRLLLQSPSQLDAFRRYDLNNSGTLNYTEFQRMLRENGVGDTAALTREQSAAFFKHFDTDGSGEVDYSELLWGFFDHEAFLKRWRERKSANATERQVKSLFLRCDRTGRGVLPLQEFQLVLDHLGVTLSDVDAKLLAVKFRGEGEGSINYLDFLAFANGIVDLDLPPAYYQQSPAASNDMERILKEIQELTATQEKLHRLLRG